MPTIPYPDVPDYPGVPDVPRQEDGSPEITLTLLPSDASAGTIQQDTVWGIFSAIDNSPIFTPYDGGTLSTYSFDFSRQTTVSTYPIEEGSFANYDKVWSPANPVVTLAFSGSESEKISLLNILDGACLNTSLWNVYTPDVEYENYTIERYSYRRMATKGATMLMIDVSLKEIKQITVSYANSIVDAQNTAPSSTTVSSTPAPQSPSAAPSVSSGQVQPVAPSSYTAAKALNDLKMALGIREPN